MLRTLVLVKQVRREFLKQLHPAAIDPMKIGGHVIPNNIVFSVLGFIFLYFITSFSAIIACINNFGPGLGAVGSASNYSSLTDFQT